MDSVNQVVFDKAATIAMSPQERTEKLSALVKEYQPKMQAYVSRYLQPQDVEDLVQDVFVRLISYKDLFLIKELNAFIYVTALNLVRDRAKHRHTIASKQFVDISKVQLTTEIDPQSIVAALEELELLGHEIEKFPSRRQEVFVLQRLRGKTYREVATQLGISVGMVEKHMTRAIKQLRRGVGGYQLLPQNQSSHSASRLAS